MSINALNVTQLNNLIKSVLDDAFPKVIVRGEISNYKLYPSGHHYFTLKDESSSISCVMFKGNAFSLKFYPDNGMQVIIKGKVSCFPRDGKYQLYCESIEHDGVGNLQEAYEKLKIKLEGEGLFDESHKMAIPRFPKRIAIVTSPVGAAIRDLIKILNCRWPLTEIVVIPVKVQGEGSANEILNGIKLVNDKSLADLIIIGRGGGSLEDLWAFNDESLARTIYNSKIPIISAVGHETDFTISDFVADVRASTPSNAAEKAVPDYNEIISFFEYFKRSLNPIELIQNKSIEIDRITENFLYSFQNIINLKKYELANLSSALDNLSPLKVLSRGYGLIKKNEQYIDSIKNITVKDNIKVILEDGQFDAEVMKIGEL